MSEMKELASKVVSWRHELHRIPELGFCEIETSAYIQKRLKAFGLEPMVMARTGVVAALKKGSSEKSIALRADMDALPIREDKKLVEKYGSKATGRMHACGHDGHMAMLLGAAEYLSRHDSFDGTCYFIFQPAEEGLGGAEEMIEEGLFDVAPADMVFGMHNWPGLEVGRFGICEQEAMAAGALFEICLRADGGHAAMPQLFTDLVVVAAEITLAFQTISSRDFNPLESVVVSVASIGSGEASNVMPGEVVLRGTIRSLCDEVLIRVQDRIDQIVRHISSAFGVSQWGVEYSGRFPVLRNHAEPTEIAKSIASAVTGATCNEVKPVMASEDFAYMSQAKRGAFIFMPPRQNLWIDPGSGRSPSA